MGQPHEQPSGAFVHETVQTEQEDLRGLVTRLKDLRGENGPFCLPIGEDSPDSPIVLISPYTDADAYDTSFVIIDPKTGYWAISFGNKVRQRVPGGVDHLENPGIAILQSYLNTSARSSGIIPGSVQSTSRNGLTIKLGGSVFRQFPYVVDPDQMPAFGEYFESDLVATLRRPKKDEATEALRISMEEGKKIASGQAFEAQREISTTIKEQLDTQPRS